MSQVDDVGISPVLLQAISQSISASNQSNRNPIDTNNMEPTANTNIERKVTNQPMSDTAGEERELDSEAVKAMLKIKMAANALTKSLMNDPNSLKMMNDPNSLKSSEKSSLSASTISDLAMANMLTALASQADPTTLVSSNGGSHDSVSTGSPLPGNMFITSKTNNQDLVQQSSNSGSDGLEFNDNFTVIKQEIYNDSGLTDVAGGVTGSTDLMKNVNAGVIDLGSGLADAANRFGVNSPMPDATTRFVVNSSVSATGEARSSPVTLNLGGQDQTLNSGSFILPNQTQTSSTSVLDNVVIPPGTGQIIEIGGKKYILQPAEPTTSKIVVRTSAGPSTSDEGEIYATVGSQEIVSSMNDTQVSSMASVQIAMASMDSSKAHTCPICGDEVSGFHYGIFTCESCKGFFKRTVQNKKSFVCHRAGECEINLENRKKCPACRFAKCLVMGMKLDAIRQDRSRGGRSSYSGLSPLDEAKRKKIVRQIHKPRPQVTPLMSESHLASALSYDQSPMAKPFVPSVLTDIMNLESLLCDDDIPQNIKADDFISSNPNVFLTLLQLCELKLYKIVRWARNLPYFANISTDDQILLLQNCWCELLALTMCWKSIHLSNEIVFFHGQTIDFEKAKMLSLGDMFLCLLAEVEQLKRLKLDQYECVAMKVIILITPAEVEQLKRLKLDQYECVAMKVIILITPAEVEQLKRLKLDQYECVAMKVIILITPGERYRTIMVLLLCLLAEVEQLKRLKLDQYECVAMKVIILITPDIKGLNDSERLGVQQQKISEALEQYTTSHYRWSPSKYGELLLRLPELSRISFMLKEQLLSWMPHENTSCGLLYELLKGENMKELV